MCVSKASLTHRAIHKLSISNEQWRLMCAERVRDGGREGEGSGAAH